MEDMIAKFYSPELARSLSIIGPFLVFALTIYFGTKVADAGWTKTIEDIKNIQIIQNLINNFSVIFKIISRNIGYILIGSILIYGCGSLFTDWYVENIKSELKCEIGRGSRY